MSFRHDQQMRDDSEIGEQAAGWLLRFDDAEPDPEDECPNEQSRNQAFYEWIETSPDHLRVFLETVETQQRMRLIDSRRRIKIDALLRHRADVIPLRKEKPQQTWRRSEAPVREKAAAMWRPKFTASHKRVPLRNVAAAILVFALGASGYWWLHEQNVYTTRVGEQRTAKLEDGSFIYLNTDSKVEVGFSDKARNIRLVRGEALFVVEHDSTRPFTVTAGDATVRAVGTQFNVRRMDEGAEVAVVEGTVQVTVLDRQAGFPAQRLGAGEEAQVSEGKIAPRSRHIVADPLAWRQRRLVFHDARLADVAAEFNRYSRTKIRIEGDAAQDIMLSGIFDADRPQALMLYAAKNPDLSVQPEGNDWVIRGR